MSWDLGDLALTEYEQQRTPHTTITDDRIVSLPMKVDHFCASFLDV